MAAKTSDFPAKQRQLNDELANGNFRPCYLIYGEESYLRYQNRDKIMNALGIDKSSMNFNRYNTDNCPVEEIISMADTMPFFADKRVILVENSGLFKGGSPELSECLKTPNDTTVFIFVEEEVDKRKDMFKAVAKAGFEIECTTQTEDMLKRWIASRFKANGKVISLRALAFFLDRAGTDMAYIENEIEKLVCYCMDRNEIKEEDIDAVCANYLTGRIFAMTDAIAERNQKKAVDLYYDLLALKEQPARILALITRQFNLMLQAKEMTDNRKSTGEIASALKIMPFVAGKYQKWAAAYTFSQLKDALELCISNDAAVKSGKLNNIISVEMVIIECTRKTKAG